MVRTREQEYAATIYKQVEGVRNDRSLNKQDKEDYRNMSEKLPVLIRSAGLVQALYFAQTRNKGAENLIKHLVNVIEKPTETLPDHELNPLAERYLEKVRTAPINEYIFLTEKCLLALKWYKRFSEIHLKEL